MIRFFLPIIPPTVTHQEKQVNFKTRTFYEPAELKAARVKLKAHLAKHVPDKPLEGPVRLVTKWLFPVTANHVDGDYKATKPDTENLIKLFKDVMEDLGYFNNDAQVASDIIEKFYAEKPGIYVELYALDQAEKGKIGAAKRGFYDT